MGAFVSSVVFFYAAIEQGHAALSSWLTLDFRSPSKETVGIIKYFISPFIIIIINNK